MLDQMFGNHLSNLSQSLDRSTRRQGMLMTNLANVNVPDYKRQDISLDVDGDDGGADSFASALARARSSSVRRDGNNVDLEREVSAIGETEIRYQAVADMTSRYFSGLKTVLREGR